LPRKHILCVDDHTDTTELVAHILKDYEVFPAYSKEDALKQATFRKFDLYIMDYHLPDGTGLELCLLIRGFDTDTPILFVTGTSSIGEDQVLIAGAQGLIRKSDAAFVDDLPVKVSQLLKA
jgi:CheY-like chemotaxis protein